MNALTGAWPWPANHSLYQRLRVSEASRLRGGALIPAQTKERPPIAPVTYRTCQWISGDPRADGGAVFCGGAVAQGKPFCACHSARAYVPLKPEEPDL